MPPSAWSPSGPPSTNRGGLVLGGILILLGLLFLADRFVDVDLGRYGWPLFVIVPGVVLLLAGLAAPIREGSGLSVAGSIVTMTGLVLAFQNATDLWATWAYAWALVGPVAAGLGLVLYGVIHGQPDVRREGFQTLGIGLALFVGFGLFFEGVIGLSGEPFLVGSDFVPVALIVGGIVLLGFSLMRGRRSA